MTATPPLSTASSFSMNCVPSLCVRLLLVARCDTRPRRHVCFVAVVLVCTAWLSRARHVSWKVGAVYALYCLHTAQPSTPQLPVRVDPTAWERIRALVRVLATAVPPPPNDLLPVVRRMYKTDSFQFALAAGPVSWPSLTQAAIAHRGGAVDDWADPAARFAADGPALEPLPGRPLPLQEGVADDVPQGSSLARIVAVQQPERPVEELATGSRITAAALAAAGVAAPRSAGAGAGVGAGARAGAGAGAASGAPTSSAFATPTTTMAPPVAALLSSACNGAAMLADARLHPGRADTLALRAATAPVRAGSNTRHMLDGVWEPPVSEAAAASVASGVASAARPLPPPPPTP